MDDRRKKALRQCHADLRTGITVTHILPKLHIDAGGFLTDEESTTIRDKKTAGNVEQVDELVSVLVTKETKDFDYFCDVLKKGHQSISNRLKVAAGLGSEPTDAHSSIIPDIMDEYVHVKKEFVSACTREGPPTLEEVKDFCIDLIECASKTVPRISRKEDDIENARTFTELARVVCFRLSKWVSYDFLKKVIVHFQPALKSVQDRLMRYEDKLRPYLEEKLEGIAKLQEEKEVPGSMAELAVKYKLGAHSLLLKDLMTERDFLAERLSIPEHLLQVISWGDGSIVITYWIVRDLLPLAELALCREDVRAELIQHGVEEVYLDSHASDHHGQVDQSLQSMHLQRRSVVTIFDAHRQDLDVTFLASDLKDMGVLTAEQCEKLASLEDNERKYEALLYTLLAYGRPDTYDNLVESMKLRDALIAAKLQATLQDLMKSPGALTVISSSQCTLKSPKKRVARQVVETMESWEPQQVELPELTHAAPQPRLKEKSRLESATGGELEGGQTSLKKRVSHLQPEKSTSETGALELEPTATKARLEEDVRLLTEEWKKQLILRSDELHAFLELQENYSKLEERHLELKEKHIRTEDELEQFKAKHAECDVTRKLPPKYVPEVPEMRPMRSELFPHLRPRPRSEVLPRRALEEQQQKQEEEKDT